MRDIKFRAWDKRTKKMRAVNSISFNNENESFNFNPDHLPKVVNVWGKDIIEGTHQILRREIDETVLMQYTGLKDKNGKEIYEGDIIVGYNHKVGGNFVDDVMGVMKYEGLAFAVQGKQIHRNEKWFYTMTSPIAQDYAIEVIGNIYENPELLKD